MFSGWFGGDKDTDGAYEETVAPAEVAQRSTPATSEDFPEGNDEMNDSQTAAIAYSDSEPEKPRTLWRW